MAETFEEMLDRWILAETELTKFKREELSLRTTLSSAAFPSPSLGTNKVTLADGRIFKAVFKENTYINSVDQKLIRQELEERQLNVEDYLDVNIQYSGRKYKEAPQEIRDLIDARTTVKPGQPKIEVV